MRPGGTWQDQDPELNGTGGQEDMYLGDWDTSSLTPGDYTLRLAVTSTNSGKGRTQALYDYYPISVYDTADETDIIWVDDAVPTGGSQNGLWNWTLSDPLPFAGTQAHQSDNALG